MDDWTIGFARDGYAIVPGLLSDSDLLVVNGLVSDLINRHRRGDTDVQAESVSIGDVSRQHPPRNLGAGLEIQAGATEPYIIGNLAALDERFVHLIRQARIWQSVAIAIGRPASDIVFHFANITRKPGKSGPSTSLHRDGGNKYFSTEDDLTVRVLIPLQEMSVINGGTAVVPGSHRAGSDTSLDNLLCPAVPAGAGLILQAAILHGGSTNRSGHDRDVLVLQFGVNTSVLRHFSAEKLALMSFEEVVASLQQHRA